MLILQIFLFLTLTTVITTFLSPLYSQGTSNNALDNKLQDNFTNTTTTSEAQNNQDKSQRIFQTKKLFVIFIMKYLLQKMNQLPSTIWKRIFYSIIQTFQLEEMHSLMWLLKSFRRIQDLILKFKESIPMVIMFLCTHFLHWKVLAMPL